MPSRLKAFAAKTTKVSRVMAKIAGIESIANIRSKAATIASAASSGVASRRPPVTVVRCEPSYSLEIGITRRRSLIASVDSGSISSLPCRAIFTAVNASSTPST